MRRTLPVIAVVLAIGLFILLHHPVFTKADDGLTVTAADPNSTIQQIMTQIGAGKIDDAIGMMDGLNAQPNLREAARDRLLHLRDEQGKYHSYDIAAVQRFTSQFETFDVMAYYDLQPVLLRFHFYRPQNDAGSKWFILGFQETASLQEMVDILKDTPMEFGNRRVEK